MIVTSRYAYLKTPVAFAIEVVEICDMLAIRLRSKAYVLDVHYEKAFQSDIVVRVSRRFQEQQIPRPRRGGSQQ